MGICQEDVLEMRERRERITEGRNQENLSRIWANL